VAKLQVEMLDSQIVLLYIKNI